MGHAVVEVGACAGRLEVARLARVVDDRGIGNRIWAAAAVIENRFLLDQQPLRLPGDEVLGNGEVDAPFGGGGACSRVGLIHPDEEPALQLGVPTEAGVEWAAARAAAGPRLDVAAAEMLARCAALCVRIDEPPGVGPGLIRGAP